MTFIINAAKNWYVEESILFSKIREFVNSGFFAFYITAMLWAFMTPWLGSVIDAYGGVRIYEMTEELMKSLACWFGAPFAIFSTLVFAIGEMVQYVQDYGPRFDEVGLFSEYFWFRAWCVVDHMTYLLIHLIGWKMASKHESIFVRIQLRTSAYMIAMLFHMFHNQFLGKWMLWNVFVN